MRCLKEKWPQKQSEMLPWYRFISRWWCPTCPSFVFVCWIYGMRPEPLGPYKEPGGNIDWRKICSSTRFRDLFFFTWLDEKQIQVSYACMLAALTLMLDDCTCDLVARMPQGCWFNPDHSETAAVTAACPSVVLLLFFLLDLFSFCWLSSSFTKNRVFDLVVLQ